MTWFVKAMSPDGTGAPILCDSHQDVVENLADQRARGFDAWIEDTSGKRVDQHSFDPAAARDALLEIIERLADPRTVFPAGKDVAPANIAGAKRAVDRIQKMINEAEKSQCSEAPKASVASPPPIVQPPKSAPKAEPETIKK